MSLRALEAAFPDINLKLDDRRDVLGEDVVRNMLDGYEFVDRLVGEGVDGFAMGGLWALLELNSLVLCGDDEAVRRYSAEHLQATEERFYDQPGGGIGDLVEWYAIHRDETVWRRAAGIYIRVMSQPQLFLEGNHRSGALMMSYLFLREGKPPFVMTPQTAPALLSVSSLMKNMHKQSLMMRLRMRGLKNSLARLLEESADRRYLLPPT